MADSSTGNSGSSKGPKNQLLTVEIPERGELKPQNDGSFEVNLFAIVKAGDVPARGAEYQFYVDGAPYGSVQMVDLLGRAMAKVRVVGKLVPARIHVIWRGQDRIFPLPDIEIPNLKPKLVDPPLGTIKREDGLEIVLQRLGVSGKPEAGRVMAMDWEKVGERLLFFNWGIIESGPPELKWKFLEWKTNADGLLIVTRPYMDNSRYVQFFLPEDAQVNVSVEIPSKELASNLTRTTSEAASKYFPKTWSTIWKENFNKGEKS